MVEEAGAVERGGGEGEEVVGGEVDCCGGEGGEAAAGGAEFSFLEGVAEGGLEGGWWWCWCF